jgi:hypothetical protein
MLYKIGLLSSLQTRLKQAVLVKQSHLKSARSKLSATCAIGRKTVHGVPDPNFRLVRKLLAKWQAVQVHSLEIGQKQQVLVILP